MKKQSKWISKDECFNKMFGWMSELTFNNNSIDCVLYNCIMDTCIQYRDINKTLEV